MSAGPDIERFLERHRESPLYRFAGFRLISYAQGRAEMECPVSEGTQNVNGDLHGGILALLVDEAGTVAIASRDRDGRPGVTTDLNVSYLAPGRPPSVRAIAQALKVGRTLGYVQVDVLGPDGVLVAQGRMTKFMGR
ncbi:MAG: PaaI family thioesterase [Deltaproteobacteria bacterium]